jgi:low temperature requirement protein LtrA
VSWIAGAAAGPATRLALWALAIGIEVVSPAAAFYVPGMGRSRTIDWDVSGAHLAERCGLFVILALGETLILTCVTFEKAGWSALTVAALLVSFATTVAMWWIYFDTGVERAEHAITGAQEPGRLARLGYTYLHLPIVAGIVLAAVGDELVLAVLVCAALAATAAWETASLRGAWADRTSRKEH